MEQRKKNKLIKKLGKLTSLGFHVLKGNSIFDEDALIEIVPSSYLVDFIEKRIDSKQEIIDSQKQYIKELVKENELLKDMEVAGIGELQFIANQVETYKKSINFLLDYTDDIVIRTFLRNTIDKIVDIINKHNQEVSKISNGFN